MKLHYFNPENDIALGLLPGQSLTMSPMVAALHRVGALLPVWYASPGDCVLVEDPFDHDFVSRIRRDFALDVDAVTSACGASGAPWGWSFDAARRLSVAGAVVPDAAMLEKMRGLSHRRTTLDVLSRLAGLTAFSGITLPVEAADVATVKKSLDEWGAVYVKQPWSSSGRGVFRLDALTGDVEKRISGMIRRQGSVMVERAFDKIIDFAMLFRSHSGVTEFVGYSLFFNSVRDSYGGNLMFPDEEIESYLVERGASAAHLGILKRSMPEILTSVVSPFYDGYFGVDMMLGRDGAISPCVEINLRMTMGVVAHIWRERFLAPEMGGVFRVASASMAGGALESECEINNNRVLSGRILLTPPSAHGFVFSVETLEGSMSELQKFLE
ncbi:MAG: hypothetical protein NC421_03840 [Lachnospiraceae bacterium]|nr:hypothetical protein [Lachnospiraceae bacterium]